MVGIPLKTDSVMTTRVSARGASTYHVVRQGVAEDGGVSEFGGESGADDVVRRGHAFHNVSRDVCMRFVCREVNRFPWLQLDMIEETRRQNADVLRVLFIQRKQQLFLFASIFISFLRKPPRQGSDRS